MVLYGHMKITYLKNHAILKAATPVVNEYIVRQANNPDQELATTREAYAIETLLLIGNITNCIDQLYFFQ